MPFKYFLLIPLLITSQMYGQSLESEITSDVTGLEFGSLDELISYAMDKSIELDNNDIRLKQANKDRLSALISTIDVTGSLLSTQFTNNTNLGVSLFPAEIFGGELGTFNEVEMGVQYNTNVTNHLDIKLFNLNGYNNVKLADLNIELTEVGNQISVKQYQESLLSSYYNIVNLQKQLDNTQRTILTSDSLLTIVKNKYDEGIISQQDVNTTQINHLKIEETERQLSHLMDQYYLSLKALCDIDDDIDIRIQEKGKTYAPSLMPSILRNDLNINQSILQEQYAKQNLKAAKQAFLPTVSLQLSNSWNLYNTEFQPFTGNWINSNYIGIKLNVPVPSSKTFSSKYNAEFEYEMAINNTFKEKNAAELNVKSLQSEFRQAKSQIESNEKILAIQKDTYNKNRNLYIEEVVGLDATIQSLNEVLTASYDLISSQVNLDMVKAKIKINNNVQ